MIPLLITMWAFIAVAWMTKSRTYSVLAFSALCNLYIDNFTSADDLYLMVVYSSIEFFTALAVLWIGDIHKLYQTIILAMMLLLHLVMEAALSSDNVWFIESGIYTYGMTLLIIIQLIGASRGTPNTIYQHWNNRRPIHLFDLQNR